jgi:hypothetical protein
VPLRPVLIVIFLSLAQLLVDEVIIVADPILVEELIHRRCVAIVRPSHSDWTPRIDVADIQGLHMPVGIDLMRSEVGCLLALGIGGVDTALCLVAWLIQ